MVAGVDPFAPPALPFQPARPAEPADGIRSRLRAALRDALAARNAVAVSALRSALGALDNAEAVDVGPAAAVPASSPHIAGAVAGLGAAEAERRVLSTAEAEAVVRAEVGERELAADEYDKAGHAGVAARLRREALVLIQVLASQAPGGSLR
jgi:uncharacterized protein YqeY